MRAAQPRFRGQIRCLCVALLLMPAAIACAASGDVDPSFGVAGRVVFGASNTFAGATSVAQQRDGKLLIGRWVYYWASNEDFSVVRLMPDGRRDPTFGRDGVATFPLAGEQGVTIAVVQLANGNIVAAGRTATEFDSFTTALGLVRYQPDGSIDRAFGAAGKVTTTFGAAKASASALLEQPDGRLVVAGRVIDSQGTSDLLIARFNANGTPDTTFGTLGSLVLDVGGARADDSAQALVLQPDGKLVAAGYATGTSGTYAVLLRLMPTGGLDTTFGESGVARPGVADVAIPGRGIGGVALQLQGDGKLVMAAHALGPGDACASVIARLNADASADLSFGDSGRVSVPDAGCLWGGRSTLIVEPGGTIVIGKIAASSAGGYASDIAVTRLTAAGELDAAFGTNGTAFVDVGDGSQDSSADASFGVDVLRQPDGRLVVVASDAFDWDFGGMYFVVARLLASGDSPGLIGIEGYNYFQVDESAGSATFNVRRSGGTAGPVSVEFATTPDPTELLAPVSGTLTWGDRETGAKTITIPFADDTTWHQCCMSVYLTLSNPSGGAALTTTSGALYILENDAAPPPPQPPPTFAAPASSGGGTTGGWTLLALLMALLVRRTALLAPERLLSGRGPS